MKVLQGDVREKLQELPEKSIQCAVTSPPYWGLRDYGTDGQLGLEPTPEEYVQNMVEVFRGVWRVLRDDGTVWLNLGDSYASDVKGGGGAGKSTLGPNKDLQNIQFQKHEPKKFNHGLKPKDLVGVPWRVAFALQADGWYLRSDIIWHKPNPMPESVTDRPTKSHEYIFLLTKSQRYFYDAEAVKEKGEIREYTNDRKTEYAGGTSAHKQPYSTGPSGYGCPGGKRNKRSVWTVATQPYPEAHFAVYPPKLIEPCILAGTSPQACEVCGNPWERVWEKTGHARGDNFKINTQKAREGINEVHKLNGKNYQHQRKATDKWQPTCSCDNEGKGRCKVLDPFAGSGTTLWVAESHGRDSVGIELNSEYVKLIEKRMANFQQTIFSI